MRYSIPGHSLAHAGLRRRAFARAIGGRTAPLIVFALILGATGSGCGGSPTQPAPIVVPPPQPPAPPSPPPPPPPPAPRLTVTRILAFGDSMTQGTTSAPLSLRLFALDAGLPVSYPYQLQALAAARYTDQTIEVLNAGLAGRRASEDLERFNRALSDGSPQVVLLLQGANDLNAPFASGEGINDRITATVNGLEEMVKSATARQIPIFVGTLPPQRPGGPKAGAAAFLGRYNDAVKVMASKKGAHLVDVFSQLTLNDVGQDGLHLTDAGYQRLAEIWLEALKGRYEVAPEAGS